jgi:hypothetical protein
MQPSRKEVTFMRCLSAAHWFMVGLGLWMAVRMIMTAVLFGE